MVMELKAAGVTESGLDAMIVPICALTVAVPIVIAATRPPALLTEATLG
jgi:hypothetical protein